MLTEIDCFEFTRSGQSAEGVFRLSDLERLGSLLADQDGELRWRLDGWRERGASGDERLLMRLRASANVPMPCGRCLGVATIPLAIDRCFLLAASEEQAETLDQDDEDLDALVASTRFDVTAMIEDEAILALPPVASHADCTRPMLSGSDPRQGQEADAGGSAPNGHVGQVALDADRQRPFADLGRLMKKNRPA